jgi:hypothetical protein
VSDAFFIYRFSLDGLLTISAAWLMQRAFNPVLGVLGQLLGWGLALLLLVTTSGEILSWLGALGAKGFLLAHAGAFFALAGWRRNYLTDDAAALGVLGRRLIDCLRGDGLVAGLSVMLGLIYIVFGLLAAWGEPVVYDALTYRLSRIGLWLQEGRITHFATDDARLNYMPVAPDLVMAWLAGAQRTGFAGVALAQTFGGGLLLVATVGLARCTGLGRAAALGAAGLLLGMANIVPQFCGGFLSLANSAPTGSRLGARWGGSRFGSWIERHLILSGAECFGVGGVVRLALSNYWPGVVNDFCGRTARRSVAGCPWINAQSRDVRQYDGPRGGSAATTRGRIIPSRSR